MPNSTDFYKGIFLHVTPVRIIVPCLEIILSLRRYTTEKTQNTAAL